MISQIGFLRNHVNEKLYQHIFNEAILEADKFLLTHNSLVNSEQYLLATNMGFLIMEEISETLEFSLQVIIEVTIGQSKYLKTQFLLIQILKLRVFIDNWIGYRLLQQEFWQWKKNQKPHRKPIVQDKYVGSFDKGQIFNTLKQAQLYVEIFQVFKQQKNQKQ
ncbi:hypothetical protein TTHERM_000095358 (macronuclear) [Tetrahymena thermophila SB210]|uniref:Uncharacterized protein n=1 Tax=Tetrahymena thermophila (strain SB210) TaxID=312017 RepID=W7XJB0_TETTS|nr:hypothetical protein TTHERM_000095358 [Tetrahymena thermophila SB210]EWS75361.1 hypothetical protein TTHERM_000095358 [Tetrahymena thermophila SB210]|eukprot:XP_012652035.1 hypothetical protein TTHERM_000095358 [Tetrahymena thermophila SB210]